MRIDAWHFNLRAARRAVAVATMAASKGAMTTYVANVVERVSYESAMVEHKPEAGPAVRTRPRVHAWRARTRPPPARSRAWTLRAACVPARRAWRGAR
jgi:hypothetical protein